MPTKARLASGGTVQPAMTIHFQLSRAFWIEPVTWSLELVVNFT